MRAVIRTNDVKIEFSGRGQLWNELLRPHLGGPEAPAEPETPVQPNSVHLTPHRAEATNGGANGGPANHHPVPARVEPRPAPAAAPRQSAAQPASPAQPRTWFPPREQQPARRPDAPPAAASAQTYHSSDEEEGGEGPRVEPSSDPATLFGRLAALPGRRSERDAVLAAVWFLTKGEGETTGDEVERRLAGLNAFPDVKVAPHLMKHVHRTKLLEFGGAPKTVRLSKKGLAYVHGNLVGA